MRPATIGLCRKWRFGPDEVIESAASVVFAQAENRLHAQKAMLVKVL